MGWAPRPDDADRQPRTCGYCGRRLTPASANIPIWHCGFLCLDCPGLHAGVIPDPEDTASLAMQSMMIGVLALRCHRAYSAGIDDPLIPRLRTIQEHHARTMTALWSVWARTLGIPLPKDW